MFTKNEQNIVSTSSAFPSTVYPWVRIANNTGAEIRLAKEVNNYTSIDSINDLIDKNTKIVCISHTEYRNGQTYDLNQLAEMDRGLILLTGPTGCGKSTIVDLLIGFYNAQQGKVLIDDVDLKEVDIRSWLSQVSVISQETFMLNGTIDDNICFGIDKKDRDLDQIKYAAKTANANGFIENLPNGYKTLIGERGLKISGGERQRIAIARAIYMDSPVLIFDEATSSLDPISEKEVQNSIDRLKGKRTMITIAHRLSTLIHVDHIFVIDKGRVVEEGTHKFLSSSGGLYNRLYKQQTSNLQ